MLKGRNEDVQAERRDDEPKQGKRERWNMRTAMRAKKNDPPQSRPRSSSINQAVAEI